MTDFEQLRKEYRSTLDIGANRAADAVEIDGVAATLRSELEQIEIQIDELSTKTGQDDLTQRLAGKKPSAKPTTDMQTLEIERRRLQATLDAAKVLADTLREQANDAKRIAKTIADEFAQAEHLEAAGAVVTAYRAFEQIFHTYAATLSNVGGMVDTQIEYVRSAVGECNFTPPPVSRQAFEAAEAKLQSRTLIA